MVAILVLKMKRLQAKEYGRPLEAGKGEEMGSPLGASREERSPANTYMQTVYHALPFFLRSVPQTKSPTNNFFFYYRQHTCPDPRLLMSINQMIKQLTDQLHSLP